MFLRILLLAALSTSSLLAAARQDQPVRDAVTPGCYAGVPSTLGEFWNRADAVAHIRIHDQRFENYLPLKGIEPEVITRNFVEVLEVFKRHPVWPASGRVTQLLQSGGDIDRGDYLQVVRQTCLDPLVVGREYVLFLERSEWFRAWSVAFDEEGAFLIEGPALIPLGEAEVAKGWRSRPSADFFQHLRGMATGVRP
jgi:hypothetical protein